MTRARRTPVGAAPGTLIADPAASPSWLRLTLISPDACEVIDGASLDDLLRHSEDWPLVWLDCAGLANVDLIAGIGKVFKIHPLALEDVVNTDQRPKTEFFDDHAFVTLSMIDDEAQRRYEQVSVFFGERFVVTFQEREGDPFEPVRRRLEAPAPARIRSRKGDYLAYALIDAIVDSFFAPLEANGAVIDSLEDDLLAAPRKAQLRELHALRRAGGVLRRALWPLRDAMAALVRSDAAYVAPETKVFLNDTLDHSIRLIEIVETQHDMLTGLIEMHLSLIQARTNDVISFLTIVSVIFIPLTFLVGVWGMNFDPASSPWNMPELQAYYGYPLALAFMAVVALVLILYFRSKKWL